MSNKEPPKDIPLPSGLLNAVIQEGVFKLLELQDPLILQYEDKIIGRTFLKFSFPDAPKDDAHPFLGFRTYDWHYHKHPAIADKDVVIDISLSGKTIGKIRELVERLQADLPNLKVALVSRYKQVDLQEWPEDQRISFDTWLVLDGISLQQALTVSTAAHFTEPFAFHQRRLDLYNEAQRKAYLDADGLGPGAYFVAALMGKEGPYLECSELGPLYEKVSLRALNTPNASRALLDRNAADEAARKLAGWGFDQFAYLGKGRDNVAFLVKHGATGNKAVAVFDQYTIAPNSPFHIPAHARDPFVSYTGLRIMPFLAIDPGGDQTAMRALEAMLEKHQLSARDLREPNVGWYSFLDKSGVLQRVPMILDWGTGPVEISPTQLAELKADKAMAPWFEAQEHILAHPPWNAVPGAGFPGAAKEAGTPAPRQSQPGAPSFSGFMGFCSRIRAALRKADV